MGMSLTYSLLNPEETFKLKNTPEYKAIMATPKVVQIQNNPEIVPNNQIVTLPVPLPTLQPIATAPKTPTTPEPHALQMANIVPLDTALQPYIPPTPLGTRNTEKSISPI